MYLHDNRQLGRLGPEWVTTSKRRQSSLDSSALLAAPSAGNKSAKVSASDAIFEAFQAGKPPDDTALMVLNKSWLKSHQQVQVISIASGQLVQQHSRFHIMSWYCYIYQHEDQSRPSWSGRTV
jgi:hypothetical protein